VGAYENTKYVNQYIYTTKEREGEREKKKERGRKIKIE
jgi:hypothetical protein